MLSCTGNIENNIINYKPTKLIEIYDLQVEEQNGFH